MANTGYANSDVNTPEAIEIRKDCTCDFYAPPLRVLRQPSFCADLAQFYYELGLSGPATLYWIQAQLFDYHSGKLFDHKGKLMDVQIDPEFTDDVWRADERRTILRFLERSHGKFRYLLQMRMVPAVTLLYFAREIYLSRTTENSAKD